MYFRGDEKGMAQQYGEQIGQMMSYFTGDYGLPPFANLAVVETESGAPNGYAAPGLIFLNPHAIGKQVGSKLLANQISREWWEDLVSPSTRNHLWLSNGLAAYSEILWTEHTAGPGAAESQFKDDTVEALTVDNVPVIQAARMEDYSPELWALTGSKGAAVLHMLRFVIGDKAFFETLKEFATRYSWKSATTEDFKKVAEDVTKQDLGYFFIQWIESSGAPEFKLEYTIFRTQKGFRVMGKVAQDMDTFRMPVDLKIETEGNPEEKRVEVVGTSSEFSVDTFGKPKNVVIDPDQRVLRFNNQVRTAVAIRRGEQFQEVSEFARCAEGIPEGAGEQPEQLARALSHCRSVFPAEQFSVGRQRVSRGVERRSGAQVDRGLGAHPPGDDFRHHHPARPRGERIQSGCAHERQYAGRAGRSGEVFEDALRAQEEPGIGPVGTEPPG